MNEQYGIKPAPERVAIAGAGGIGTWVAVGLVHAGTSRIEVFDPDRVERSNLNRLPYSEQAIGMSKVEALSQFIDRMERSVDFIGYSVPFTPAMLGEAAINLTVVDCTDNLTAQKEIFDWCRQRWHQYWRVGSNGNHITIARTMPGWLDDEPQPPARRCGVTVPQFLHTQFIAAGVAVAKICAANPDVQNKIVSKEVLSI